MAAKKKRPATSSGRVRKVKRKPVPDLIRRQRAIDATMLRFGGKNFKLGKADCVQLARYHLVKMGHRRLPKATGYSTPRGAMAVLGKLGAANLEELFDKLLTRIPPAAMLPGDIGLVALSEPHEPAWQAGSVGICVGRKWLGWHADHAWLAIIEPNDERPFKAAWRA